MEELNNKTSRKNFLIWGALAVSAGFFIKLFSRKTKVVENESNTVKMLTEDGRLVEIDRKLLASNRTRLSNDEIHDWVKN